MKKYLSWRYCAMSLFFAVGFLCLAMAMGDGEWQGGLVNWLIYRIGLVAAGFGAICFAAAVGRDWMEKYEE